MVGILQRTKDALDSIKHPGQTYDGVIQELIGLWESERGAEETGQRHLETVAEGSRPS